VHSPLCILPFQVIIVTGPTAVGKTAVGLELAKRMNGEVISADSVQVYRTLDIGSDKVCVMSTWRRCCRGMVYGSWEAAATSRRLRLPRSTRITGAGSLLIVLPLSSFCPTHTQLPLDQRQGIPHHLIDVREHTEEFSAGDFHDLARAAARDIIKVSAQPGTA
jgi:hypothetical protein